MSLAEIESLTGGLLLAATRKSSLLLYAKGVPDYRLEPLEAVKFSGGPDGRAMLLTVTTGNDVPYWEQVVRITRDRTATFTIEYRLTEASMATARALIPLCYGEKLEVVYSLLVAQTYRLHDTLSP